MDNANQHGHGLIIVNKVVHKKQKPHEWSMSYLNYMSKFTTAKDGSLRRNPHSEIATKLLRNLLDFSPCWDPVFPLTKTPRVSLTQKEYLSNVGRNQTSKMITQKQLLEETMIFHESPGPDMDPFSLDKINILSISHPFWPYLSISHQPRFP